MLRYSRGEEPHLNLPGPALNNVNRFDPLTLERVGCRIRRKPSPERPDIWMNIQPTLSERKLRQNSFERSVFSPIVVAPRAKQRRLRVKAPMENYLSPPTCLKNTTISSQAKERRLLRVASAQLNHEHCGSLAKRENENTPRRNRRGLPSSFYSN